MFKTLIATLLLSTSICFANDQVPGTVVAQLKYPANGIFNDKAVYLTDSNQVYVETADGTLEEALPLAEDKFETVNNEMLALLQTAKVVELTFPAVCEKVAPPEYRELSILSEGTLKVFLYGQDCTSGLKVQPETEDNLKRAFSIQLILQDAWTKSRQQNQ